MFESLKDYDRRGVFLLSLQIDKYIFVVGLTLEVSGLKFTIR